MAMAIKRKFRTDLSEALHSSTAALRKVGALDEATMCDFCTRHLLVPKRSAAKSGKVRKMPPA